MVSPVDAAASSAGAHLQALSSVSQHDSAGAKTFSEMMKGAVTDFQGGQSAHSSHRSSPNRAVSSPMVETMQQMSRLIDPNDSVKTQYVLMDVLGQRMEYLGKMHITMSLTSGFTNVFKQLLNRHE